jgi:4'-phosphopantetheinyl transferase
MTEQSGAHVYYTRVTEVSPPAARYMDWLSAEERARYRRFRFDVDRQVFLMAHALVRSVLGEWAGVAPSALRFETAENGKPAVAVGTSGEDIQFNLSHTRGLVACAVSRVCPVGVDVEGIDVERDVSGVARRVLSQTEYHDWNARTGEARARRFFEYWTLKEAYIKALGVGLDQPLRDLTFTILPGGRATVSTPEQGRAWLLRTYQPVDGYLLSVALRPAASEVSIRAEERTP